MIAVPKGAGVGWIIGVVLAVLFLIAIIGCIVFFSLAARRRKNVDQSSEEIAEKGCLARLCGACHKDKPAAVER